MGVRRDGNQLFAIGTINADYLGPSIAPTLPNTTISNINTTTSPQQQQEEDYDNNEGLMIHTDDTNTF